MPDPLTLGREAIQQRHWDRAIQALTEVDGQDRLDPEDLLGLGDAYWWTGQPDEAIEVFERAFAVLVRQERKADAARVGAILAYLATRRLSFSVAGGWVARVEDLLRDEPESASHGWLRIFHAVMALEEGKLDQARDLANEAIEIGRNHEDVGVEGLGLSFKGIALIQRGEWRQGISLIDQGAAVAMLEGGDLRAASDVYCNTIAACRNLADYRRAGEWTEEAERWMKANSIGGYTGICQVHRAELKRLKGSWSEAERDAKVACNELRRFRLLDGLGFAHYEVGEVRRRMGDLAEAEESFMRAYEYGHPAQPGYALLLLDRGQIDEADQSIARALGPSGHPDEQGATALLSRARLLPARVEISLAMGEPETAREAVEELEQVSQTFTSPAWEASALTCRGSLQLHQGRNTEAQENLDRAWRLWQEIDLPYEAAQARLLLARALLGTGDQTAARLELRAARTSFESLGAATDLRRIDELMRTTDLEPVRRRERTTRTFMFTDIVTSTDLIGLIGDSAWESLLEWHDRTLRETISRYGGEEVRHTGDGFFVTFDDPRAAIESAVAIQRRLLDHRREHGFAPWIRIGLHEAVATHQGDDYAGQGVHVAARVGDLGDREEIVASADLLASAGSIPFAVSAGRTVKLKGVAEPLLVHTIEWR